jgi:hypothetical protein
MTVGQGRPHVCGRLRLLPRLLTIAAPWRWPATSCAALWLAAIYASCAVLVCSVPSVVLGQASIGPVAASPSAEVTGRVACELRIVWGGDTQRIYTGKVSVDSGTIKPVRNLSLQSDSIGTVRSMDAQTVEIFPSSLCVFGGVDVAVTGSLTTKLYLSLSESLTQEPTRLEVSLAELMQGNWIRPVDERGNRVAIERQMHDRVRITSASPSGIMESNQAWPLTITGYRTGLPEGPATAEVRVVRQGQVLGKPEQHGVTLDANGSFGPLQTELQSPAQEGAYLLEVAISRRGYLNSFVSTTPSLIRRLDVVVFDPVNMPQRIGEWKPLAAIDPVRASKPGGLAWLSSLDVLSPLGLQPKLAVADRLQSYIPLQTYNPLAGSLSEPISHGAMGTRQYMRSEPALGQSTTASCLTLAPRAWLAIPLTGLVNNSPHRVRVRVPTDRPMELAISLQQTNVAGEFPPLSLDSGIIVGPRQASQAQTLDSPLRNGPARNTLASGLATDLPSSRLAAAETEHDVVFWPRGNQAYLMLANLHGELDASVAYIQLERALLSPATPAFSADTAPATERMVGINLDKPLLADSVSGKREMDPITGRPLESWSTWQESIERICQLLKARDSNTLLVKGFSEGGAIFPSDHLVPTFRYDSGTFYSDGRAPEIKDALELMLRHFDRQQLKLILAVDLNTPLPGLERLAQTAAYDATLQQPLALEAASAQNKMPRYNPLNPRVQEEIIAVVRELITRYGHHRALAGITIQLDGQSQLIFAGDRWGYDPQTLAQFEKAAQLKLPPREELETVFSGASRLAFLDWRAAELTKFYIRLGEVVQAGNSQRKLYLNAVRLWDDFPSPKNFINPEAIIRNPREYMLAFGISAERLAQSPHVELMRGSFELMNPSVHAQDWIRHESGQRGLVEFFAGTDTSAMVLRYPRRHQLEATDKLGDTALSWIYPTLSLPSQHARKKMINQIFHSDPLLLVEGGWLPFSGQDADVGALLRTLGELPPIKLESVALRETDTNVRVRKGVYQGKSYVQVVNNASWTETLRIDVRSSRRTPQSRLLGGRQADMLSDIEGGPGWAVTIPPYEMLAIEVDDPQLTITSLEHAPSGNALQQVRDELERLDALISQSADVSQQKPLANIQGEFEQWDENQQPVGWSVSTLPQVTISKSLDLPRTGNSSLYLENRGQDNASAWAQSRAVEPPRTGRLAVQAWLRAPAVGPPLLVKLSVIGRTKSGERFERSLQLGSRAPGATPIAIDWGRKPATLFVGDVSSESLTELAVSVELIGPGKVWVDDVQILESLLQPDERNHLRGQLLVAQKSLAENNPFPAEQLLDSHWGEYLLRYQFAHSASAKVASLPSSPAVKAGSKVAPSTADRSEGPTEKGQPASWDEAPSVFQQFRESLRDRWRR